MMKNFWMLFVLSLFAASVAQAQTVVTTTTTTTTTSASGAPSVTYAPANRVTVVEQVPVSSQVVVNTGESDLYHRQVQQPQIDNGTLWAVGAGATVGAVLWDSGYRHGRRHRRWNGRRYYRHRHW